MSNSLDPDQARHYVGPDLDPNCLQRLSADDTSSQRVYFILSTLMQWPLPSFDMGLINYIMEGCFIDIANWIACVKLDQTAPH